MDYRKEIKRITKTIANDDFVINYLDVDDVTDILAKIEDDVVDIYETIRAIEGISEIDETKTLLEELLRKLY
ncbi:hypothetical protein ACR77J_07455 [Tissierella praeacuta]|uniref:hypothetical protein n=1 Tax=Tissierella praeacuta TaxID=43131 RepID=UPI003DA5B530